MIFFSKVRVEENKNSETEYGVFQGCACRATHRGALDFPTYSKCNRVDLASSGAIAIGTVASCAGSVTGPLLLVPGIYFFYKFHSRMRDMRPLVGEEVEHYKEKRKHSLNLRRFDVWF